MAFVSYNKRQYIIEMSFAERQNSTKTSRIIGEHNLGRFYLQKVPRKVINDRHRS